jgi:hypothetical protein
MKTLTLKIPEILETRLNVFAHKNRLSRSEIVRRALVEYFSTANESNPGSFLDLAQDLAGSIDGSPDLSTNKTLLEGYGK